LVKDHTQAKQQMAQLASTMGMTGPAAEPKQAEPDTYTKLSGLSGKAFDHAFVADMVNDHKKDIAAFQAEADSKNGAASALAARQLPVLKKHLRMAEALQKQEGG
jgi:putative membrane protein